MEDPYKVLGVKRDASEEDIRRAYRRLAKQYHPDLNPGKKDAEERFKAITAAHELLSNPETRARYDRGEIDETGAERQPDYSYYRDFAEGAEGTRYRPGGRGGFGGEDFSDIFSDLFGRGMGRDGRARTELKLRGSDVRYVLSIDFLDAINGATRRIKTPDGKTLDVSIPAGIDEGRVLRLKGQGEPGFNGGPSGDALIEIRVIPDPIFRRVGNDIHVEEPITLTLAVLGGRIAVPTRTGVVKMTVPEGSDTGRVLRLRGRGVPAHDGQPAGDQYVTLKIVLGSAARDEKLKAFLREWSRAEPSAAGSGER